MATIGTISETSKNLMLNALRNDTNYSVVAANAAGTDVSDYQTVSFNVAGSGKLTLSSTITLTVDVGSDGSDAVAKIFVVKSTQVGISILNFTLDTPIDFANGGSLVITQLDVELADPE